MTFNKENNISLITAQKNTYDADFPPLPAKAKFKSKQIFNRPRGTGWKLVKLSPCFALHFHYFNTLFHFSLVRRHVAANNVLPFFKESETRQIGPSQDLVFARVVCHQIVERQIGNFLSLCVYTFFFLRGNCEMRQYAIMECNCWSFSRVLEEAIKLNWDNCN